MPVCFALSKNAFDANEPFSCKTWAEKRTVHAAAQSVQHSSNMVGQRVIADFPDIPQSGQHSGRDGYVLRAEVEVFASEAVVNPAVDSGRHDGGLRADLGKEQMVGNWRVAVGIRGRNLKVAWSESCGERLRTGTRGA